MKDSNYPYVSAIVLVALAFLIRLGLTPLLNDRSPWLLFTIAIVIAAGRYGVRPALLAMMLSLILGLVAFVGHRNASQIPAESIASLVVFLLTGLAMLVFAAHLKSSQERAIQLQAELGRAHTQSALGTMASMLAHELNQPLAAAANYMAASRIFTAQLADPRMAQVIDGLDESEAQLRRVAEIIRQARGLVTAASTEREPLSLTAKVERSINLLRAGGGWNHARVATAIDPDAERLMGNRVQLEQVLVNLLRNAFQAGGDKRSPEVVVAARTKDDMIVVEVRDDGPGIPEDRLPALFSARSQSAHGGLGLGLSICRTIIEAHGGHIWAANRPGGGASFFFTVPRSK